MANILINGFKANAGGGKMILENFLDQLYKSNLIHKYYVLTPFGKDYEKYQSNNIILVDLPHWCNNNFMFPLLYYYELPKLLNKKEIDLIFNFGDVIIPGRIKQIYFFDWSYAVYNEKYIWSGMHFTDKVIRKVKVFLIKKYIGKVSFVLAQTKNVETRLNKSFKINKTIVIPTPVGVKPEKCNQELQFENDSYNFFYPASYSPHKNHKILIEVAKQISQRKLKIKIYITINSIDFIASINSHNLSSIIINLGTLNRDQMNCAYQACDGVIFPTLLETYGLPYYEAMAYEKPIFTSDLDFAKEGCGNAAIYFNPFDAEDILDKITTYIYSEEKLSSMKKSGQTIYTNLPTWSEVIFKYNECINHVLEN